MLNKSKIYFLGIFELAIANSCIGINVIINKFLIGKAPILLLLELRYLFGFLILLIFSFLAKKKSLFIGSQRFSEKDWIIYILMTFSGGVIFNLIYMLGLDKTTAISVGIIGSTLPSIIAIFSFFILKQSIRVVNLVCIFFVIIGVIFLSINNISFSQVNISFFYANDFNFYIGNLIVFLAMIPEALFTIFSKMIKIEVCPIFSSMLINLLNAVVCLPFAFYSLKSINIFHIDYRVWLLSFLIGLYSGALFYVFYIKGISKVDANTAALMTGIIPTSTTIFAVLFLNEVLNINKILGILCVLISIYIGVKFNKNSKVLFHRVS